MTVNRRPTGTASSIPTGLTSGAIVFAAMTLAGALLTAYLIESEMISWDNCGYAVMIILLFSSWCGTTISTGRIKRQRLLMAIASGGLFFVMLLATTALFFGGQFSGVGETGLLVFCGSMLACFVNLGGKTGRKGKKIRLHNR